MILPVRNKFPGALYYSFLMNILRIAAVAGFAWFCGAVSAQAANGDCFCAKKMDGGKYQVVRFAKAECKGVPYKSNGRPPWENGVGMCKSQTPIPAAASPAELDRRCYCFKSENNGGIRQHKLVNYPTAPQCKQATYSGDTNLWNHVMPCDLAEDCKKNTKACSKKLEQATKKLGDKDPVKAARASNEVLEITKRCKEIDDFCYVKPMKNK